MAIVKEHELHDRRRGRNIGVGLTLVAFVAIVFGLTVVKVSELEVGSAYERSTGAVSTATNGEDQ